MVAPTYSGLTVVSNFDTGDGGTATGIVSPNSDQGTGTSPPDPLNGLCYRVAFVLNLATGSNFNGIRVEPSQVGSSGTVNCSTNKFILHWRLYTVSGDLNTPTFATRANRGIVLRLYSNAGFTIYREWLIAGSDSDYSSNYKRNDARWTTLIIDADYAAGANATVGAFAPSTIFAWEFRTTYTTQERQGFYFDMWLASNGVAVVDGDSGTPASFSGLATFTDITSKAFLTYQIDRSFLLRLPLQIGNGSTATRWDAVDSAVQHVALDTTAANPQLYALPPNYLGITINQSATDYYRSLRCLYSSTNKWALNISGSTAATFIWQAGSISNLGTNSLGGAAAFNGVTFAGCDRLNPTASRSFVNCTITTSTDTVAAFDWDGTQIITGVSFTNNVTPAGAVRINAAGTYSLSANTFTGNTKNFNVTAATGTVTIITDAASTSDVAWASSFVTAGATVVFQVPATIITVAVSGAPIEAAIGIFKRSASLVADRNQFALAAGNNSGNTTLVISTTIPLDTPAAGYIRVVRDSGAEDRLRYASYTGSTFTLFGGVTLPLTYTTGNGAYVGYLDVLGTVTGNESNTIQYVVNRDCVLVVRKGSGIGRIQDIRQNITLTNTGQTIPISGVLDSINNAA